MSILHPESVESVEETDKSAGKYEENKNNWDNAESLIWVESQSLNQTQHHNDHDLKDHETKQFEWFCYAEELGCVQFPESVQS